MSEVTRKVDELISILAGVKRDFEETEADILKRDISQDEREKKQNYREEDLNLREVEIKKVEDVIALKSEADRLLNQHGELRKAFEIEQNNFRAYVTEEVKKINISKADNDAARAFNKQEFAELVKQKEAFAKEKETYKQKLAEAIVEQADKR